MQLRETEYDPWSGETKKWYFDNDGNVVCERSADLTALINNCKAEANYNVGFKSKQKFHKVASLHPLIQHELLTKHNLDCFSDDPSEKKRLEQIIERDYPYLKTNSAKLWRPTSGTK